MKNVTTLALVLVIVGALNWGLVALFNLDLVALLFGSVPTVAKLVYVLVGVSGLYMALAKLKLINVK